MQSLYRRVTSDLAIGILIAFLAGFVSQFTSNLTVVSLGVFAIAIAAVAIGFIAGFESRGKM